MHVRPMLWGVRAASRTKPNETVDLLATKPLLNASRLLLLSQGASKLQVG